MLERAREIEATQQELSDSLNTVGEETGEALNILRDELGVVKTQVTDELAGVKAQMNLLIRAAEQADSSSGDRGRRAKVPEPKHYDGARDAKELENFLFDIGQYFKAIRTETEEEKVSVAAMYLTGDAKLWWRSKFVNDECPFQTWGDLKQELKKNFFPENVEYMARRKLRELIQTGIVREFVRELSTLMLDIRDMSEKDKMFYFLDGLKPWAMKNFRGRRSRMWLQPWQLPSG